MEVAPDLDEFIGCLTAHGVESHAVPYIGRDTLVEVVTT